MFPKTNAGILVIFCILSGLSLNSYSILGASVFKRAQLSGITVVVIALVLGIAAQISAKTLSTAAVAILGILFTPMTFVFHMIWLARYEHRQISPNLVQAAPGATWKVPGIALWVFMIIQTVVYPVLAAYVERALYRTSAQGRKTIYDNSAQPVVLTAFTKHYRPNWFFRTIAPLFGVRKPTVQAVNDMSVAPMKGQIMVLVGANGCGKSTTLVSYARRPSGCNTLIILERYRRAWRCLKWHYHGQWFRRDRNMPAEECFVGLPDSGAACSNLQSHQIHHDQSNRQQRSEPADI